MELISRADAIKDAESWVAVDEHERHLQKNVIEWLKEFPTAELGTNLAEVGTDCISRQGAIDAFNTNLNELVVGGEENAKTVENYLNRVLDKIKCLPSAQPEVLACGEGELSAQPERTCVNCGRTVNNGGWYADGRTRCPIEEHYALPKDGYCHLWEKRKDWEDDYVKRAEEGEK